MTYSTAMRTVVDIAGYLPFFATLSVTTQVVEDLGALSLVPTIEHRPDSLQVFFPVDTDDTSHVSGVLDFLFTIDFFTVNPGRAAISRAADATCPVAVLVVIANV